MPDAYVVDKVPYSQRDVECREKTVYYVHMKGYAYVPVFGSFGSYSHAKSVADMYNLKEGKR